MLDSTAKHNRSARPALLVISGTAVYFLTLFLVLYVLDRQLFTGAKQELIRNNSHRIFTPPESDLARDALHHPVPEVRARAQATLREHMEDVVNGPTSTYHLELRDRHDQVVTQASNPAKIPEYNTWRNSLFFRTFSGQTSAPIRPLDSANIDPGNSGMLLGRYTSPRNFEPIETLTTRYRGYAVGLIVLWLAVYAFLYLYLLKPVQNVTSALESSRDRPPLLLRGARGALETGYNALAGRALLQQIVERLNHAIHPHQPGESHNWGTALTQALDLMTEGYGTEKLLAAEVSSATGELTVVESFAPTAQQESVSDAELLVDLRGSGLALLSTNGKKESQFESSLETGDFIFSAPVTGGLLVVTGRVRSGQPDSGFRLLELRKACESLVRGHHSYQAFRQGIIRERSEANIVLSRNLGHDLTNIIATSKLDLMAVRRLLAEPGAQLDGPRGEVLRQSVSGLLETTRFLQEIVNLYRAFSYVKRPMYERRDLRGLIEEFLAAFEPSISAKVKIRRELEAPMPPPIVEPRLLKLALFNVLTNALDAVKKSARSNSELAVLIRTAYQADKGVYRIELEDNGPGIRDESGRLLAAAEVQAIFEYGYSTKSESSEGLGLSWVRTIVVDFHDGGVTAENLPEGGARITLSLKSMERREAKVGAGTEESNGPQAGR